MGLTWVLNADGLVDGVGVWVDCGDWLFPIVYYCVVLVCGCRLVAGVLICCVGLVVGGCDYS